MVFNGKPVPLNNIYKMYAATLYLQAAAYHIDEANCKNVFQELYKHFMADFDNNDCLSVNKMEYLRSKF